MEVFCLFICFCIVFFFFFRSQIIFQSVCRGVLIIRCMILWYSHTGMKFYLCYNVSDSVIEPSVFLEKPRTLHCTWKEAPYGRQNLLDTSPKGSATWKESLRRLLSKVPYESICALILLGEHIEFTWTEFINRKWVMVQCHFFVCLFFKLHLTHLQ